MAAQIQLTSGDLFESGAEALVNPVNTVGVMGKGLALAFKRRYPDLFRLYKQACFNGQLHVGAVQVLENPREALPWFVINFPTKQHWRDPSRLDYIRLGLHDLTRQVIENDIRSVAMPALGCGLGGLDWAQVRPLIVNEAAGMPDHLQLLLYEPN